MKRKERDEAASVAALETLVAKAQVLTEALPFIQKYRGSIFVIKYGGSAMDDEHIVERALRDFVFLQVVGIRLVVIHGGGNAISDRMRQAGLKPQFVSGLRVTDAAAIRIVEETLDREVNPGIVAKLEALGASVRGFSGTQLIRARRLGAEGEGKVDRGFVGEVASIDRAVIEACVNEGVMPVLSPLGRDADGVVLNINADLAAAALAGALGAAKLIYLSDVPGLMRDPAEADTLISTINREMIDKLIHDGVIAGGMIPKMRSASEALASGVGKVHLIDGRVPHALLVEVFITRGLGTEIVA